MKLIFNERQRLSSKLECHLNTQIITIHFQEKQTLKTKHAIKLKAKKRKKEETLKNRYLKSIKGRRTPNMYATEERSSKSGKIRVSRKINVADQLHWGNLTGQNQFVTFHFQEVKII